MRAFTQLAIVYLLLSLGGGCSGEATEVLVITDSDLVVPTALDFLQTTVMSPAGDTQRSTADLTERPLPRILSLVHETGPLGPFNVAVAGGLGGVIVVSRTANFDFVQGETRVLRMHLVAACQTTVCAGGQTCSESGCRDVDVVEAELSVWTGSPPRLGGADGGACGAEQCNRVDDDCDGTVDEGFDLLTDPNNCGSCGNGCGGRANQCCGGACQRRCP